MPTFKISPDERTILIIQNNISEAEFDSSNPNYKVEPMEITLEWRVFEDELAFEQSFKLLLRKYHIEAHYDDLMYIVLITFDNVWINIQAIREDYESKKRARELAQLLLLFEPTQAYKPNGITFKTPISDAKLKDEVLIKWVSDTLLKSISEHQYSPGQFGITTFSMVNPTGQFNNDEINYSLLKDVAKKRLINPKNSIKKGQFELCLKVYQYLQLKTTLKAVEGTTFSDNQLTFLFDLLVLLKQVDEINIESEPKDYMSGFMYNFMK